MARIYKSKNAYRSLVEDARNFIDVLNGLNLQLEIIQKKLNDLLAAKRAMFPRFYFLSNKDLLEMIGQAKDPATINKHISKIYEGINTIKTEQTQAAKGQREHVITTVVAEDGETLSVVDNQTQQLELTTNVESWMKNLTEASKQALEREFSNYAQNAPAAQGRKVFDRERMTQNISGTIGQILLTFNQIEWTNAVKTALLSMGPDAGANPNNPLKKLRTQYKKKIETYIQVVE